MQKYSWLIHVNHVNINHFTNDVTQRHKYCSTPDVLAKRSFTSVWQSLRNGSFELVEAIIGFKKSSMRNCRRCYVGWRKPTWCSFVGNADGNKPELIGRVLEKWRNDSSASAGEESTGAVASLGRHELFLSRPKTGPNLWKVWATSLSWICLHS